MTNKMEAKEIMLTVLAHSVDVNGALQVSVSGSDHVFLVVTDVS